MRNEIMGNEGRRDDERMNRKIMGMMERISFAMLAACAYGLMTQVAADDVIGTMLIRVIVFLLGAAFTVLTVMDVFDFVQTRFGGEEDPEEDFYYEENDEPDWMDQVEIVDFMNYDLSDRKAKYRAV